MRVEVSQFEGIDTTSVLPLAAGCLVAAVRADGELGPACELAIAIDRAPIADAVAALGRPDVLGLALYPWNATYSLAVAAAARVAWPHSLIVVGGPSVPRRPERARRFLDEHPALDLLVFGEGELTFCELLRARLRGDGFAHVGGIAIRGAPAHTITAPPVRVLDFTPTASPFLDGTFDELMTRERGRFAMALCETNRGCPFSCTFCDWSLTRKVVEFPLARVEAELAWVAAHGLQHVMLADANFGIRPRDAAIARYVAALRLRTGLPSSFYWYLTKNDHARNLETIDILHAAGIGTWVGLAVQDFDDDVLAAVKRDNIQTGEAQALRRICGERGIPTFNELILGLPGQTYASFVTTIATAMPALPRHDFVLFLCRLIDNAELGSPESRAAHGLETRRCLWKTSTSTADSILDEYQEIVVATHALPGPAWQRAYRVAFFAAALYNLRLLRVVLHHVVDGLGADRGAYLAHLADQLATAAPGTVYAALDAVVERYLTSLLACGPLVLPLDGGELPVYVDEALATSALGRYDDFLAETAAHTGGFLGAAPPALAEAFRYQSIIIPRWLHDEPSELALDHDWPTYVAAGTDGAAPVARATRIRYLPPSYVGVASFAAFASTHWSVVRARLTIGDVEPLELSPATGVPTPSPRRLVVLPASG